jgi:hypothetical protein
MQTLEPINQVVLFQRPRCEECRAPTTLARIEPTDDPDYDLRTFQCIACDHVQSAKIKFR